MFDLLGNIVDFITLVIDFIISFFRNVIEILALIFKGFGYVVAVVGFMPIEYKAAILALVSFSVIVTVIHFGD